MPPIMSILSKGRFLMMLALLMGWLHGSLSAQAPQDPDSVATDATAQQAAPAGGGADIAKGKELFEGNCKACHKVHERAVGPALAGISERRDEAWIIAFVKNSKKVIDSGDAYAVKLYNDYNKTVMPAHEFLSDDDVRNIVAYVNSVPLPVADVVVSGGGTTPVETGGNSSFLLAAVIALTVLLLVLAVVMIILISVLAGYLKKAKGLTEEDQEVLGQKMFDLGAIVRSQAFIGTIAFIFVAVSLKATFDGLWTVGVQQGYAPTQPIPFSHKLHAGYYEIDCKYCHTGVEKGKSAVIPSANVCMNCHNSIRTDSKNIQKIYDAIANDEPIQWVRVHNLPDLSYFNHAQHVKVAGIECQTCHGNIQEMEVVQQISLLTMGWCINCHRETNVKVQGNEYYERVEQIHKEVSKEPLKVEDIGGLECSKCHY
ncbi:c-type cytochrome [Hugenholtzia roseola]|uniref:c-type cytochrome n=1 Tax=Hugenholtzia roseola TaxID=1002 RepID=UPI00041F0B5D|nr:c-type cytochrome [Hugenholtzia roseola]